MEDKLIYLAIALILAFYDILEHKIPNWIVIPASLLFVARTGHFVALLAMFAVGAILFQYKFWHGGDVKLLAMLGAFFGFSAIWIFVASFLMLIGFMRRYKKPTPYAPFAIGVSILFLL